MIAVTGASGKLGRLAVLALLQRIPAAEIVALVRTPDKATDLAEQGVAVRLGNYDAPETLTAALKGVNKLLLVSSNAVGQRLAQHKAVIDAAVVAKVGLIAYTSILGADTTTMRLAQEHKETETLLQNSGLPFTLLRNGWYLENYTETLAPALEHGVIVGASGDGRIAAAARADYAAAAAAVLTTDGHAGKKYELAGDSSFSLSELAQTVSKVSGKAVVYQNLSEPEYAAVLTKVGLPKELAEILANCGTAISKGELNTNDHTLSKLTGKPTQTLEEAVNVALGN